MVMVMAMVSDGYKLKGYDEVTLYTAAGGPGLYPRAWRRR